MKEIVFATNNRHKIKEIQYLAGHQFKILGLKDIGCFENIPEDHLTLEENASAKSLFVRKNYNINCFADDTGLEIDSLKGEPGVFSARYARLNESHCNTEEIYQANIDKVLKKLHGIINRKARFRTIISLRILDEEKLFEGVVKGHIINDSRGNDGFGYDPIFLPDGSDKTFAEMSLEEKNKISHRGIATRKLVYYLLNL